MSRPLVAVTGATGFLGLHLVAALAQAGAAIRVLARRDPAHEAWEGLRFETIQGSLEDEAALAALCEGADAVIHAAGLIKALDLATFLRTNRDGTARVARMAQHHAPEARFILISSLAAREPQLSSYAFSKRAAEDAAWQAYQNAPERLVIVRPPAIYGPWDRETLAIFKSANLPLVPLMSQSRVAMIHVSDAAAAIARLALGAGEAGLYTLADDHPEGYLMSELLAEAARAMGRGQPRFLPLPPRIVRLAGWASGAWGRLRGRAPVFTAEKAEEILHPDWSVSAAEALPAYVYKPRLGLAEGCGQTVAWYRAKGCLK
ncbi:MAG: SDR family NAD(P)-dependent oxidoreductase [Acidocella sp.]|nr:SDR family NAD(P)-dependent oxidoreductase [Acidocella sp.]